MKLLGKIDGVKIFTPKANPQENLDLAYMPESILQKIKTYAQKVKKEEKKIKSSLLKFALDKNPEKNISLPIMIYNYSRRSVKQLMKPLIIQDQSPMKNTSISLTSLHQKTV